MAEVWEAHDENLDRAVAVKMLHGHLAGDAGKNRPGIVSQPLPITKAWERVRRPKVKNVGFDGVVGT